jgi:hypothetical protein
MIVLAVVACAALATSAGWAPSEPIDRWLRPAALLGVALIALGIVGSLIAPVARMVTRTRCARCRAPIERGQTYCNDHLRETVAEYRDREHDHRM